MKRLVVLAVFAVAIVACQSAPSWLRMGPPPGAPAFLKDLPGEVRSGLPVNYTQERAGTISIPNLLVSTSGKLLNTPDDWLGTRRPEIRQMLLEYQYGMPVAIGPYQPLTEQDYSERGGSAFGGTALRTQSVLHVITDRGKHDIDVLLYTPAKASGASPVVLMLNFSPNVLMVDDPAVKDIEVWDASRNRVPGRQARVIAKQDIKPFLDRGYGVAMVYYGQIEPDFLGGSSLGMRKIFGDVDEAKRKADDIGAIGMWAEGLSLVRAHLARDPKVDGDRIALYGISRLGKAVLWAGANDPKFAAVIAVCSGEGGAALSRRNYGETVGHVAAAFPYWFAPRWSAYAGAPSNLPVDAHMVLAMMAPRPLMLITGETDAWSDPYGEFLSARLATPIYRLFEKEGVDGYPPLDVPTQGDLVFMTHKGGHGMMPQDTPAILGFLDRHLKQGG